MRRTFLLHHGIPTRNLSPVILILGSLLLWLPYPPTLSHAQVPPITSSGLNTQVSDPIAVGGQTQYDITGGTRPGGGANLFHSFGDFSVPTNNIANFLNAGSIDLNGNVLTPNLPTSNILGRVTGGDPSVIFGMIQTNGPNGFGTANLFLMNPAGFLFGPNATVNVGGMVAFTSADYLKLTGNAQFNAIPNVAADALLTALPVASFGFLGSNPGAITVQGSQFAVTDRQSISLVGGDIEITAGILDDGTTVQPARFAAPGGQINLASVTSPGKVLATSFLPEAGMTRGSVTLSQGTILDVSANAAGTVRIRSGALVMNNATISADTVNADGAPVAVDISVMGDLSVSDSRGLPAITARTTGLGNAGEVRITSTNLEATSSALSPFLPSDTFFAIIDTHTSGIGTAGNVSIDLTGNLNVTGQPTGPFYFIDSGTVGLDGGHGGDVTMTAENIQLQNVNISTGDEIAVNSRKDSAGSGGNMTITADTLTMTRSTIATDGFWAGRAGDLTINVRDIGMNTFSRLSLLEFEGGGKLTINADRLIADSAQFDSETVFGPGGGFTITAKVVELKNGTTLRSQTLGDGDAGDIRITATDHLTLADRFTDPGDPTTLGARIRPTGLYTNSLGNPDLGTLGNAGSIIVTTPRLEMIGGARINSTTQSSGHGGDVIITATNQITISGERPTVVIEEGLFGLGSTRASGIYTRTIGSEFCTGTCGDAGHVSVTTGSLTVSNGAVINSGTTSTGRGGDITVHETDMISISGTMVDGTPGGVFSQTIGTDPNAGKGGNIILKANSVTIQNGGTLSAATTGSGNAGNIRIHADTLALDEGAQIQANTEIDSQGRGGNINVQVRAATLSGFSGILTNTLGPGDAGDIRIQAAQSIALTDDSFITSSSFDFGNGAGNAGLIHLTAPTIGLQGSRIISLSQGPGNAGIILLEANTITASDQTFISSETIGHGKGGDISIRGLGGPGSGASDVSITGQTTITSSTSGDEDAGEIAVLTERMTLTSGSLMNTSTGATGDAGNITIDASESVQVSSVSVLQSSSGLGPTGNAGQITITTPTITVDQGGFISTSTSGAGNAGSITVNANSVSLLSGGQLTSSSSLDPAPNTLPPTGSAGTVTVKDLASPAQSVLIDGAGSGIFTDTQGTGAGGNIFVNANSVTLQNGGTLSAATSGTAASATGGTITVDATNTVTMNRASITASSTGVADAGSIDLTAMNGFSMQNSTITTQAGQGAGGGNIKVSTSPEATVLLQNSLISASVADGRGGGGNISIDPQFVILQNSQILAQAAQGQGGAITIIANLFLPDANSIVNADSGSGVNGTVTIQSPNAPISGQIQPLGKTPLIATSLLNQHCSSLAGGEFSSFTVAGRDSLPTEPGGWLSSPLYAAGAGLGGKAEGVKAEGERLEGMSASAGQVASSQWRVGDTPILSLRQIAPAGFLTQAFAVEGAASCQS